LTTENGDRIKWYEIIGKSFLDDQTRKDYLEMVERKSEQIY